MFSNIVKFRHLVELSLVSCGLKLPHTHGIVIHTVLHPLLQQNNKFGPPEADLLASAFNKIPTLLKLNLVTIPCKTNNIRGIGVSDMFVNVYTEGQQYRRRRRSFSCRSFKIHVFDARDQFGVVCLRLFTQICLSLTKSLSKSLFNAVGQQDW